MTRLHNPQLFLIQAYLQNSAFIAIHLLPGTQVQEVELVVTLGGLGQLTEESVDQVGVLQHHRDLLKHVLKADVVLGDGIRREVTFLVELHHGWSQAICLQGQKSLCRLQGVCK